jgi:hypothetical protein
MSLENIEIWDGCAPAIATAVEVFCDRWGPYSTKSSTRSIFKLFEEVIEPAWNEYVSALPSSYSGNQLCQDLKLGQLARTAGFQTVEGIIATILRRLRSQSGNVEYAKHDYAHEFEVTLDTMQVIIRACYTKRPKKRKGRSNRVHNETCQYCGEDTELKAQSKLNYESEGASRLSAKFCSQHRPKFSDGTRNSEYLRAARHAEEYQNEVSRMQLQAASMSKPNAQTGDVFLDLFYFKLLSSRATYPNETPFINNQARTITHERVNDRKKRMIMMRASGFSLSTIANAVGAKSRQAVSKAIASIPSEYRFDIKAFPSPPDEIFDGLNPTLVDVMKNDEIIEIHLNPDGVLWAEFHRIGIRRIGKIQSLDAENIIRRITEICDIKVNSEHAIIEADIPSACIRFTAALPPIVDNPAFAIRKMATDD